MKESPLTASEYRALLKDVKKMVAPSKKRLSDTKLGAYWSIGKLFTTARRVSIGACFQNGTYLNDLLVQKKHAKVVAATAGYQ